MTAAKWHELGIQLEIPPATLNTIEYNYRHNVQRCMTDAITTWLQNTPDSSWAKLAEAVEAMGGYAVLAERLRQKTSQG